MQGSTGLWAYDNTGSRMIKVQKEEGNLCPGSYTVSAEPEVPPA